MSTSLLSRQSQDILRELNRYHEDRLLEFERHRPGRRGAPRVDLARVLMNLATGVQHGEDREYLDAFARDAGIRDVDPQRPFLPFTEFRDLTVASASGGGYLKGTDTQEAVDILRPWSVTARAGIMIDTGLVGDQAIPRTSVKSTPYWLTLESTQVTASQPTLVQMACTPHSVGIVINFSRQLAKQTNAEFFVRRELMRSVGTAVDQAVLSGPGSAGQPLGLLNTPGLGSTTGTSLGQAGVCEMKRKCADANANDSDLAFLGTPSVRELLEKRERATGSGFVWDADSVATKPAYVSTDVPTATLICGAWPLIYVGMWGSGFTLEINPFDPTNFKSGVIQARILVSMDVAVLHPAAFCKSESIT